MNPTASLSSLRPFPLLPRPRPTTPVSRAKWLWRRGLQEPDALRFLEEHPEILDDVPEALELIYEEFCLRHEQDEIEWGAFVAPLLARFPELGPELRKLRDAHDLGEQPVEEVPSPPLPAWEGTSHPFPEFVLLRELGYGGFARVYLARQPRLGNRLVALKVSRHGSAEAKTLGRLGHPNIVPVYSVHHDQTTEFTAVCMPYLGTVTLRDALERAFAGDRRPARGQDLLGILLEPASGERPPESLLRASHVVTTARLGLQMAEALAFVHDLGVCHRDLKPSNVLLTPDGRALLLDFNLSFDGTARGNRLGGTVPYMSPEQLTAVAEGASEEDGRVGPASDLFSLGVMLYEMLAGCHPFVPTQANPPAALLLERQKQGPAPIRQWNPQVPAPLARLVEDCLAYRPEDRPADAKEVASRLRAYLQPRRWRIWTAAAAAAAGFLMLGGLAGASYLSDSPSNRGRESLAAGQYQDAIERFTTALQANPKSDELLYARGRARLLLGGKTEWAAACEDFDRVGGDLKGQGQACLGYCLNRLGQHETAIQSYERAIAAGVASAEVFNNLGYCYLQRGSFDEAKKYLDRALELNPRLQPAKYNRALAELRRLLNQKVLPRVAARDINEALADAPVKGELAYNAARVCAMAGARTREPGDRRAWLADALRHLETAVDEGYSPKRIAEDMLFEQLHDKDEFQNLVKRPEPKNEPTPAVRLLDPAS